jgi:hypothetical protein
VPVRFVSVIACLTILACSQPRMESTAGSRELIPAEWTVAEDTSASGEVTTASLQLPAAREIPGLVGDEESRLVLRCIDHRVEAFLDTESSDSPSEDATDSDRAGSATMVPIQLDSAPACE